MSSASAKPPRKPRAAPDPDMRRALMSMSGSKDDKKMAIDMAIEKYGREAVLAKDLTGVWPNKLDSVMGGADLEEWEIEKARQFAGCQPDPEVVAEMAALCARERALGKIITKIK